MSQRTEKTKTSTVTPDTHAHYDKIVISHVCNQVILNIASQKVWKIILYRVLCALLINQVWPMAQFHPKSSKWFSKIYRHFFLWLLANANLSGEQKSSFDGSIHLQVEIAFRVKSWDSEFWLVFSSQNFRLVFPSRNFRVETSESKLSSRNFWVKHLSQNWQDKGLCTKNKGLRVL